MDIVLVVLRLIHIVAGVLWVGTGFFSAVILLPSLANLGADAGRFMMALGKNRAFALVFPITGVLTVLAGIILYLRPGASGMFSTLGWAVLSIGALAGIGAVVHGGAVTGRLTGEYVAKVSSGSAGAEVEALAAKLRQHTNISLVMLIVALVGMASARYLV
jgi:uncharacterized membrane protein